MIVQEYSFCSCKTMLSSRRSENSLVAYIRNVTPILFTLNIVYGYNMDVRSPIVATGQPGTYFGFSVDIHREGNDDMFIVGAPKGDSNVTGATRTGAVYKCHIEKPYDSPPRCGLLTLDTTAGSQRNKSEQWLGATVKSSGPDGAVMSCAPFYKVLRYDHTEISGKCFVQSNKFANVRNVVLCEPNHPNNVGFLDGTSCLAGLSGDLTEDGTYIIGAPGGFAAQGSVYAEVPSRSNPLFPRERDYSFDGSIQGYSVAHGRFTARREINYVAGAPRANNLYGQVFIYEVSASNLREVKSKTGEQIGSNFGHCVVVSDLNDDGLDDLVVGAPSYWNEKAHQAGVGQIYVYYQNKKFRIPDKSRATITGKVANGRFGLSIAALGDINDDGVKDLAVGAPYDEDGAVFIYHGRRIGKINTEPSQVLRPASFGIPFQNFGFTLAGGRDADRNSYADLLVGDYASDKVILVRTKAIIRPTFQILFDREGVNITSSKITVGERTIVGFSVTICMGYEGKGTPDSYNFTIQLTMDAEKQTSRAFFYDGGEQREINFPEVSISKHDMWCKNFSVALRDTFADKLTPIVVQISGSPVENEEDLPPGEIAPVVDSSRQYSQGQIPILFSCLNEGCTSDLEVNVESDQTILYMGDSSSLTLTVTVENKADDAFAAQLYASVHTSLRFAFHTAIESVLVIRCEESDWLPGMVVCDVGNPLPKETRLKFNMTFDIPTVPGDTETLSLILHANSTTTEEEHVQDNNHDVIRLSLEPKIDVILYNATNLPQLVYNDTTIDPKTITSTIEAGEEIIHTYWIDNLGPGTIHNATLEVNWPMKTEDGDYLLYLTEVSLSSGETCDVTGTDINPLNLKIPKPVTENLDEDRQRGNDTVDDRETSRRKKRAEPTEEYVEIENELPSPLAQTNSDGINVANCSRNYKGCIKIKCSIADVPRGSENVVLTIRSRLWSSTLPKDNILSWDIVSSAILTIHQLPYVLQPEEGLIKTAMVTLSAVPETLKEKQTAPPWSIIFSVLVGLVLLLLIILILWKLGFFKRKKFDKTMVQDEQKPEEIEEVKEEE